MLSQIALLVAVLAQQAPMSLQDCIAKALRRHPDLAVARSGIDLARVEMKATRAGYLPGLTVQSSDSYYFVGKRESIYVDGSEVPYPQDPYNDDLHGFGLYLRQNLFDGGKYWNRPRRAEHSIRRAELDLEVTREGVALSVIEAYYNLLGQRQSIEVLREALDLSQAQLELARERHQLGASSKVDVSKARLAAGEDRIAIEHQAVVVDQAQVALNRAMGRPPVEPLSIQASQDSPLPQELPSRVAEDHMRLRRNRAIQGVADLDVEIAAADLWPTVTGGFSYSRQDPEFYKVYSRFDQLYQMNLSLTIAYPIFEGFATLANIEKTEVQAERVRRERRQIRHELEASLANALKMLQRLRTIQRIEAENVAAAEDSLTLARERYQVGEGTALEIRDAQLAVTRVRLARVQTRYDLQIELAMYHHARGDLLKTYLPEERQ